MNYYLGITFFLWMVAAFLAWRAERVYRHLPEIPLSDDAPPLPSLSIIIPARNEVKDLPILLRSLSEQQYPSSLEVIVVDDNSQDETGRIAESFGFKVIRLTELPPSWLGKPHACQRGADVASGEWLLFTDADTIHHNLSASSAVSYAMKNNLDAVSLFLKHITTGWYDAVVLGTAFTALFAGWGSMEGMFNGQFILVKRSVFITSGGFEAVRQAAVEDVALGRRLQELGYSAPVLRGEKLASVYMYRSPTQLWHGLTRLGSGTLSRSPASTLFMIIFIAQIASPVFHLVQAALGQVNWIVPLIAWLLAIPMVIFWMRRIRSAGLAGLAPLGAVFIIFSALWGVAQRLTGLGNHWKGRRV
jgi:cellulose synthase/poly-beta-1,6-N-acetylglucosamine synthase-like glycosyltransferase